MRKFSLTLLAAAIGLAPSQASAADLPRKAPPAYIPPPLTWTGCYIGANVGGAFGDASATFNFGEVSTNGSGFAGGGQIGCDYQFAGTGWVIGFRNMFDGTSNDRSRTIESVRSQVAYLVNFNNQWFDTLTGRVGYAVAPAGLLYFQGGGAWAHTSTDITFAGVQTRQGSNTRSGWTIGGGVDGCSRRRSVFVEGNWMDFGTNNRTLFTPPPPVGAVGLPPSVCQFGCPWSTKATEATVLVGVNCRFGRKARLRSARAKRRLFKPKGKNNCVRFSKDRREAVFLFPSGPFANVRYWHKADNLTASAFVRYWTEADKGEFRAG